ncbi:MAG: DUF2267 domain-containing protein [Candidatus Abyssobacteria bacterium SURF_5]|uniref:DUF2267 domain-containing protein n=1 Tax=Abyssobacteria bacterium (strain SURF_5) TaxID=2093360 RepID=A0A3A4P5P3_ABYX5|nr:MAG: DUF2267 domain-containing protein [Candidatus Abyssubacteria bacterium SURF_5]
MSQALEIFDKTFHKTNRWLQEIMSELSWDDRHKAYLALRATLQTLRDRLTLEEAVQFGAQLPMLIRGFYYEGWEPAKPPVKMHKEDFLSRVKSQFDEEIDAEQVVKAVFRVISRRVTEGEMEDVKAVLPQDLEKLWPAK